MSAPTAENATKDTAQDLSAKLAADGTRHLLAERLHHALTAFGAEHGILHRVHETAGGIVLAVACLGHFFVSGGFGGGGSLVIHATSQHFRCRVAIHGFVVL